VSWRGQGIEFEGLMPGLPLMIASIFARTSSVVPFDALILFANDPI